MKKRSIILSVLAAACCLVLPVGCDKEEPLVTYTQDEGTARMSRAEVVADTIPETTINFNMVRVKAGTFTMGCTPEQGDDCWSDESPAHSVTLDGYYIGETEVTQALWTAVMGTTVRQQRDLYDSSWDLRGVGSNYPMYYVNYDEAVQFARKLSQLHLALEEGAVWL